MNPARAAPDALVGSRAARKEDDRFLTGRGRYVDDVNPRGLLHIYFLRSRHPHAVVKAIDTSSARRVPGVTAVITGADLAGEIGELDLSVPLPGLVTPTYPALATDRVRYQGEPVAAVIAATRALAEDAAALIEVDYEPLPAVVTVEQATAPGGERPVVVRGAVGFEAPPGRLAGDRAGRAAGVQLHEDVPGNTSYSHEMSNGDVDGAFARAYRVIRDTIDLHRWASAPMETRGGVAEYDAATSMLTYHVSCQSPHLTRFVVSTVLRHPQHLLRIVGPDVGGSFGLKWSPYREDVLICAIARRLQRPVKWIEDRRENLIAAGHGRDHRIDLEIAVSDDGRILGMRADIVINAGAYPVLPSAAVTCGLIRTLLPGPYRIDAFAARSRVVLTNTASHVSLRGPWAIETLARERAIDLIARELGISPAAVRERNLLTLSRAAVRDRLGLCARRVDSARDVRSRGRPRRLCRPPGSTRTSARRGPGRGVRHGGQHRARAGDAVVLRGGRLSVRWRDRTGENGARRARHPVHGADAARPES